MSVVKFKAGGLLFEVEARGEKSLFEEVAHIQEVFDQKCGKCNSEDVQLVVRDAETKDGKKCKYYEMRCRSCGARLAFGVHQEGGTLFPKRKGEDGEWLPSNGWTKWDKELGKAV